MFHTGSLRFNPGGVQLVGHSFIFDHKMSPILVLAFWPRCPFLRGFFQRAGVVHPGFLGHPKYARNIWGDQTYLLIPLTWKSVQPFLRLSRNCLFLPFIFIIFKKTKTHRLVPSLPRVQPYHVRARFKCSLNCSSSHFPGRLRFFFAYPNLWI